MPSKMTRVAQGKEPPDPSHTSSVVSLTIVQQPSSSKKSNLEFDLLVQHYQNQLNELNINSKPIINGLTIMAEDYIKFAPTIVHTIEEHLKNVDPSQKLPILYLIDSILKNVKKDYPNLFAKNIVSTFCSAFEKVNENTRKEMYKVRVTWAEEGIFLPKKILEIDTRCNQIECQVDVTPTSSSSVNTGSSSILITNTRTIRFGNPEMNEILEEINLKEKELSELESEPIQDNDNIAKLLKGVLKILKLVYGWKGYFKALEGSCKEIDKEGLRNLFGPTVKAVLSPQWGDIQNRIKDQFKNNLKGSLSSILTALAESFPVYTDTFNYLIGSLIDCPWPKALTDTFMNYNGMTLQEAQDIWVKEGCAVLEFRLEYYCKEKNYISGIGVAKVGYLVHQSLHENANKIPPGAPLSLGHVLWDSEIFQRFQDLFFLLLILEDKQELEKWASPEKAIDCYNRLYSAEEPIKSRRIAQSWEGWNDARIKGEILELLHKYFWRILKGTIQDQGLCLVKKLVKILYELTEENGVPTREGFLNSEIFEDLGRIVNVDYIYAIVEIILEMKKGTEGEMDEFLLEYFLRAMTEELRRISAAKNKEQSNIAQLEAHLSSKYLIAREFLTKYPRTSWELSLNAFSLNPTPELLNDLFNPVGVTLEEIFSKHNWKKELETITLQQSIIDNLCGIIKNPEARKATLSSANSVEELKKRCREHLEGFALSGKKNNPNISTTTTICNVDEVGRNNGDRHTSDSFERKEYCVELLEKIYQSRSLTADVHLLPGNAANENDCLPANKTVLAAGSPYFQDLFYPKIKKEQGVEEGALVPIAKQIPPTQFPSKVNIPIDKIVLELILKYIYLDKYVITLERWEKLMNASKLLKLNKLMQKCRNFLNDQGVTKETWFLHFRLATNIENETEKLRRFYESLKLISSNILETPDFASLKFRELKMLVNAGVFADTTDLQKAKILWYNREDPFKSCHFDELIKLDLPKVDSSVYVQDKTCENLLQDLQIDNQVQKTGFQKTNLAPIPQASTSSASNFLKNGSTQDPLIGINSEEIQITIPTSTPVLEINPESALVRMEPREMTSLVNQVALKQDSSCPYPIFHTTIHIPKGLDPSGEFNVSAFDFSHNAGEVDASLFPVTPFYASLLNHSEKFWDYIKMKNQSKEVIVFRLEPASDADKNIYKIFFGYLSSKGILGAKGVASPIKNIYLLPMCKDMPIPPALLPFDGPGLSTERDHTLLAIVTKYDVASPSGPGPSGVKKNNNSHQDLSESAVNAQNPLKSPAILKLHHEKPSTMASQPGAKRILEDPDSGLTEKRSKVEEGRTAKKHSVKGKKSSDKSKDSSKKAKGKESNKKRKHSGEKSSKRPKGEDAIKRADVDRGSLRKPIREILKNRINSLSKTERKKFSGKKVQVMAARIVEELFKHYEGLEITSKYLSICFNLEQEENTIWEELMNGIITPCSLVMDLNKRITN